MDLIYTRATNQLYKCFENKHYPNIKIYVSQFGNIERSGHVETCAYPGVHPEHWVEIPFSVFAGEASPEALVMIEFINTHKKLPNFYHVSYENMKLNEKFREKFRRNPV